MGGEDRLLGALSDDSNLASALPIGLIGEDCDSPTARFKDDGLLAAL